MKQIVFYFIALMMVVSCTEKPKQELTPWGSPVSDYTGENTEMDDSIEASAPFSLSDIQTNGELIMLTLSGPDTYYDYHGRGMGRQYLLCERFAQQLGVSLRVEVCVDTADLVNRLLNGEGDIIALQLAKANKQLRLCKMQWAVKATNTELADTLDGWYKPELLAEVEKEESFVLSSRSVTRRVYSPMLDRSGGVISKWDYLFQKYAPTARWDWRLLAAQCYQESTFDPQARSWVGACGLMQIMPGTARHLGLPQSQIFEPEPNVAAGARYIRELSGHFSDIPDPTEQIYFVLAAYNGGFFHIRDAMTLAQKHGRNPHRWQDVSEFVLKLSDPHYYKDPMVKYGYMRGTETVNYVKRIRERWADYSGSARPMSSPVVTGTPQRAHHKNKYKL